MSFDPTLLALFDKWLPYILGSMATLSLALLFFALQLMRYGPAIRKLNNFETIAKLAYFADRHEEASLAFGKAAASSDLVRHTAEQLKGDLDSLRDVINDIQGRLSEYNADAITKSRLEEELPASQRPPNGRGTPVDLDALYMAMMREWDRFLEVFRKRLVDAGITPKLERLGRMTYELADRRRRNPLPTETADLITALHSQYKRYSKMRPTMDSWLTQEVHDNFVQLVDTAIMEIQKPAPQGELAFSPRASTPNPPANGTGTHVH